MIADTGVLTEGERQTVAIATAFARESVLPEAAVWERERRLPRRTLEAAAAAGLTGLLLPESLGGRDHSATALACVLDALAGADLSFAFSLVVHNNLMGSIARYGNPDLQARYLPALQRMELLGAFLLTEPGGGSDAAAITTTALRDGGGWVLNGRKAWVTNGAEADVLSVYAQTDPEAGSRGIAAFLVDAETPGVVREESYELIGGHALGTNGYRFENCRVSGENLLVPAGEGFRAAMAGIDLARVCVAAMCVGVLRSSLDEAVAYTKKRNAFGAAVSEQQGMRWQLADVATDLQAAALLTREAAARLDASADASYAAAHAKKFATRAALSGVSDCMQALGANGLRTSHPLARHLAAAKIAQYLDGTTEIQNIVISRELFR